jgi:hypothetical protein
MGLVGDAVQFASAQSPQFGIPSRIAMADSSRWQYGLNLSTDALSLYFTQLSRLLSDPNASDDVWHGRCSGRPRTVVRGSCTRRVIGRDACHSPANYLRNVRFHKNPEES